MLLVGRKRGLQMTVLRLTPLRGTQAALRPNKKPEQGMLRLWIKRGGYFFATGVLAARESVRRDFLRLAVGRLTTPDLTALS